MEGATKRRRKAEAEAEEAARRQLWIPPTPTIVDEESIACIGNLERFIRPAWEIVEPGTPFLDNWHIGCICDYLMGVTCGDITRLLINIPPRYMKSYLVTIFWPVWEWLQDATKRYLFDSYSSNLMTTHSVARRNIIESAWFRERYCNLVELTHDTNRQDEFANTRRGIMIANRTATGKGGNRVIIDDPLDPDAAYSEAEREAANRRFDQKLSTRLNNKKEDAICVVMQRVHKKDVSGRAMDLGYTHLKLPGVARVKQIIVYPTSGQIRVRQPGDILWPEREDQHEHDQAKLQLGTYGYSAQYDQEPAPVEGGIVKREWWKFYRALPGRIDQWMQSWDMTFKDTDSSDHVAGCVGARVGADIYITDLVCERMSFIASSAAVLAMRGKWPKARKIVIEDAANGPAIEAKLKKKIRGIKLVGVSGSKEERVHAASPDIEAGNIYLPLIQNRAGEWVPAPWAENLMRHFAEFPKSELDDDVDAVTQLILHMGDGRRRGVRQSNYIYDDDDDE